jgi:hypothetical protein
MATIKRIGYGQVEPNHLSAQRNGQVYGQLPCAKDIKVLENGQFVKYDYENNEVNFTGAGEWMLVMNEVKLYDSFWRESYKDFALVSKNFDNGIMVPRVLKTMPGDIFTTNCIGARDTEVEVDVGDVLSPNAAGYLAADGDGSIQWQVVKVYTMPDGQPGVKLMRIK